MERSQKWKKTEIHDDYVDFVLKDKPWSRTILISPQRLFTITQDDFVFQTFINNGAPKSQFLEKSGITRYWFSMINNVQN